MSKKDPAVELSEVRAKLEVLEEVLVDLGETLSAVNPDPDKATLSGKQLCRMSRNVRVALHELGYREVKQEAEGSN